jgi:hypothetical protein
MVVSLQLHFIPQEDFWHSFLLEDDLIPRPVENSMIILGSEPITHFLNQLRYHVPHPT